MAANPQRASELLKQVYPPDDFNDSIDDIGVETDAEPDESEEG